MRNLIFISILSVFIFAPTMYLVYSFNFNPFSTTVLTILSILTFSFPFLKKLEMAQKASFLSLAILHFLLIFTLISDAFGAVINFNIPRYFIVAASLIFLVISFWWGRKTIVKQVQVFLPELPNSFNDFKIVQLSDLHIGHSIKKDYIDKVLNITKNLNPDLIVLTGDIGDSIAEYNAKELSNLKNLLPPFGKLYVTGNHEYFWNANSWINELQQLDVTPLLNTNVILQKNGEKILVAGITDMMDRENPPNLTQAQMTEEKNIVKILLTHRPTPAPLASELGFKLMISGHTHAGQFFPWTRIISFFHKHHQGLSKENEMYVYVNSGTGSWGPLMRLDSTAEITCLTLTNKS